MASDGGALAKSLFGSTPNRPSGPRGAEAIALSNLQMAAVVPTGSASQGRLATTPSSTRAPVFAVEDDDDGATKALRSSKQIEDDDLEYVALVEQDDSASSKQAAATPKSKVSVHQSKKRSDPNANTRNVSTRFSLVPPMKFATLTTQKSDKVSTPPHWSSPKKPAEGASRPVNTGPKRAAEPVDVDAGDDRRGVATDQRPKRTAAMNATVAMSVAAEDDDPIEDEDSRDFRDPTPDAIARATHGARKSNATPDYRTQKVVSQMLHRNGSTPAAASSAPYRGSPSVSREVRAWASSATFEAFSAPGPLAGSPRPTSVPSTPRPSFSAPSESLGDYPKFHLHSIVVCDLPPKGASNPNAARSDIVLVIGVDSLQVTGLVETVRLPYKSLVVSEIQEESNLVIFGVDSKDDNVKDVHSVVPNLREWSGPGRPPFVMACTLQSPEDLVRFTTHFRTRAPWQELTRIGLEQAKNHWKRLSDRFRRSSAAAAATRRSPRAIARPAEPFKPVTTLFQYPFQTRGAVTITSEDVLRLNDGEFLNDSLIDFQIKWITEHAGPENLARCIVYNSFFHRKIKHLCSAAEVRRQPQQDLFNAMGRWNKDDIFTKDFLLIPMNETLHWFLGIVVFPHNLLTRLQADKGKDEPAADAVSAANVDVDAEDSDGESGDSGPPPSVSPPCAIIILDSLGGLRTSAFTLLRTEDRSFLHQELKRLHPEVGAVSAKSFHKLVAQKSAKVPMQMNHSDCGLFVLKYMEKFLDDPDGSTRRLLANQLENWFQGKEVATMRQSIQTVIEAQQHFYEQHRASMDAVAAETAAAALAAGVPATSEGDDMEIVSQPTKTPS